MKTFTQNTNGLMVEVETGGTWVPIGDAKVLQAKLDAATKDTELIEAADRAMREVSGGIDFDGTYGDPFFVQGNDAYGERIVSTLRAALEAIVGMGKGE